MNAVVAGGGVMGSGIAAALAIAEIDVELADVDADRAAAAVEQAGALLDASVSRGKLDPGDARGAGARITAIDALEVARTSPAVAVEAVPEDVELKRDVLARLERLGPELLASNTSALSIDALATGLRRPERFIGLHFFNPVLAMRLVEVVLGDATDEPTRARAVELVDRIGKEPVVVRDVPGFATSRLGVTLGLEAIRMVQDGVASAADIDRAMVLGYRHPVGPLRLTDIVGLDVRLMIARNLQRDFGSRFEPPRLLEEMVEQGKLGRKTGQGFYDWETGA